MGLEKGRTNNPNGRPKGSKNKVDSELRDRITRFLKGKFGEITKEFSKLEGRDKMKFYTDLLQYGVPKLSAVTSEIDLKNKLDAATDEQLDKIMEKVSQILEGED